MTQHHPITAVVTGASSGIGLAITQAFLSRGDRVVGNGRSLDRLHAAATTLGAGARFLPIEGDIGHPETAERIFDEAERAFGRVDVLVNNAGIFIPKPLVDYTDEGLESLLGTNLRTVCGTSNNGEVLHQTTVDRWNDTNCAYQSSANLAKVMSGATPTVGVVTTTRIPRGTPCPPL